MSEQPLVHRNPMYVLASAINFLDIALSKVQPYSRKPEWFSGVQEPLVLMPLCEVSCSLVELYCSWGKHVLLTGMHSVCSCFLHYHHSTGPRVPHVCRSIGATIACFGGSYLCMISTTQDNFHVKIVGHNLCSGYSFSVRPRVQ